MPSIDFTIDQLIVLGITGMRYDEAYCRRRALFDWFMLAFDCWSYYYELIILIREVLRKDFPADSQENNFYCITTYSNLINKAKSFMVAAKFASSQSVNDIIIIYRKLLLS